MRIAVTISTMPPRVLCQLNRAEEKGVPSLALVITRASGRIASMQSAVIQCRAWLVGEYLGCTASSSGPPRTGAQRPSRQLVAAVARLGASLAAVRGPCATFVHLARRLRKAGPKAQVFAPGPGARRSP